MAEDSFFRMVTRFPKVAEGWNNLAYTLNQLSCADQAVEAQRCASALSPDHVTPLG